MVFRGGELMSAQPNDNPRRRDPAHSASLPRPRWTFSHVFDSPIDGVMMYEDEPARIANYTPPPAYTPVLDGYGIEF